MEADLGDKHFSLGHESASTLTDLTQSTHSSDPHTVFLVDDDPTLLLDLTHLLGHMGFSVEPYGSPREFLNDHRSDRAGCAVFDARMSEIVGLELYRALSDQDDFHRPLVFIKGGEDVPIAIQMMKDGAVDYLAKPIDANELYGAVSAALEKDRVSRDACAKLSNLRQRYATLTRREREVFAHVISGQLNKQIAGDLGTVEKTIKVHRSHLMDKLGARSVVDLVRMAEQLGIEPSGTGR
jgi:FixJ family two-component response regulator